ncbi:DUF2155 domain-containing protein [Paracoccus onubensis]|uniref:DUF2155 domain-containing protein n=1 Tax=Paracoccus onubensis TaxID=1675788 RepID=A0A418SV49_9RHOB|nr:DUF2155 domain-containing protein [Paracoccus onubensis]RJE84833.1 DUF2155 domain-containing protein [Paracoccus onubensis]
MSVRRLTRAATALVVYGFAALPLLAQEIEESDQDTPPPVIQEKVARANTALLRGLDKVSGRTTDLTVGVGEAVQLGRLEIRLGECRYPADDPSSDAYAQLTIIDQSENVTRFSGWMIASSPALSALDDARYDVWVISCQI